jgi:hypothetical protein
MSEFALPETRYALSGDVNIAYQVMGAGPVDIIMVPGVFLVWRRRDAAWRYRGIHHRTPRRFVSRS